jgi:hypothetical protein
MRAGLSAGPAATQTIDVLERGREFAFSLEPASVRSGSGPRLRDRAKHAYTTEPRRAQGRCPAHFCSALRTLSDALHRADRTRSRCQFARAGSLRGHGSCAGSRPQHGLKPMPSRSVPPSWPQAVHRPHRLSLSLEVSGPPRMTAQAMVRAPRRVQHGWG